MKAIWIIAALCLTLIFSGTSLSGQQNFSVEEYMKFREANRDISAAAFIAGHPAPTTYYSGRQVPTNLEAIPWFDSLNRVYAFTKDERAMLEQNQFMVSERLSSMDWAYAFIGLYSKDLPLFLSSDFILFTLHSSYDAILQTIEWQFLEPNLKELLHALYEGLPAMAIQWEEDERMRDALEDVDLYISVALSLAEGEDFSPRIQDDVKFREVMDAIAAEQMTQMKLFTSEKNRKLDFSQFTPRGHYDEEIYYRGERFTLENYFRAMMWLGRIDFLMTAPPENPWEPSWKPEELRRMQQGALLLNELLYSSGKLACLEKHEEIISFMVGPDDNLTPAELRELSTGVNLDVAGLFDTGTYDEFALSLNASDDYGQKIMSNFFLVNPDTTDPGQLPVSFRLLGQKFLVDSYVFSEVVFDRIIHEGKKVWRPLPDPLDVMAALGNEDALALLEEEMDKYKYAANMAGLKYLIESYDEESWEESLYNTWLAAIRSLNPSSTASGLPYFMRSTAWHHEKLNAQLSSWAQLRHDNILYGKQSYTGGTGCSFPLTYVEPSPELYDRLSFFAETAEETFGQLLEGLNLESGNRILDYYRDYAGIMAKLGDIARKELGHQALAEDEVEFLKTMINNYMASGPSISGWYNDLFFDSMKGLSTDFTVADVHTQPTDESGNVVGNVLHVGNGKINMGVFFAPNSCNPGQLVAYAGPVSSFHYEVQPNFKRLNDQEWEDCFWQGKQPSRPDWVASYLLDGEGKAYPKGRELEGSIYKGSSMEPSFEISALDYLLVFPNPASDASGLRFLLNQKARMEISIYDGLGRKVYEDVPGELSPAEYNLPLPVSGLQSGLYLVKVSVGSKSLVRQLVLH